MGTRGLLGFIQNGIRTGCYNRYDSYPSGLGDAIIKFIISLSDKELEEMRLKVEQVSDPVDVTGPILKTTVDLD
jgi:hypothetical protein